MSAAEHDDEGGAATGPPRVARLDARERLSRARRERNEGAFLAEAAAQGFVPDSSTQVWFEPAADLAEPFGIHAGDEICVRDRVLRADGHPVLLAVSRFPRSITAGTALERPDTGPGGAPARLDELGHGATRYEEVVTAAMATELERRALETERAPLLHVRRTTWSGDRVVELTDVKMPAGAAELRYSWDAC
ncbi:UTRA domain-containing protein [Saccharopolyspora gregorii]|uniref:UbiC transcription regulator-associated domain-containing protein n=1 Tax=Saccharopolyspora gregorii TaxID=33914 RepID=A0ABP6RL60_9PSEU|nr:UTRA domain-containing protein [Saccharopolyspora gregorii]